MSKQTQATARVTLTVEVSRTSTWGSECTVNQIYEQAGLEAKEALRRVLNVGASNTVGESYFGIIGEPKVVCVLAEQN